MPGPEETTLLEDLAQMAGVEHKDVETTAAAVVDALGHAARHYQAACNEGTVPRKLLQESVRKTLDALYLLAAAQPFGEHNASVVGAMRDYLAELNGRLRHTLQVWAYDRLSAAELREYDYTAPEVEAAIELEWLQGSLEEGTSLEIKVPGRTSGANPGRAPQGRN